VCAVWELYHPSAPKLNCVLDYAGR
jgi:hypothetical protein